MKGSTSIVSASARAFGAALLVVGSLAGCSASDEPGAVPALDAADGASEASADAGGAGDAGADAGGGDAATSACPDGMLLVDGFCIDRFEAPNRAGELPLVMYTFVEAEAWCAARDKRLCFDEEWTRSCGGAAGTKYPYADTHQAGVCNDDETWRLYDQTKLNGWPLGVSAPAVASLAELLSAARAVSTAGKVAADHVEWLYQAEPAGHNDGCVSSDGVFDTQGNVEEWTRRRDGGSGPDFSGSLKGRYWAEARTCQGGVTTHGNGFRFYEIGFRCCRDRNDAGG
jgi:formylglycine-generating enzyme required for sulfatase activity